MRASTLRRAAVAFHLLGFIGFTAAAGHAVVDAERPLVIAYWFGCACLEGLFVFAWMCTP